MTLVVLSLAQFLLALDYSIVYVALPSIAADLGLEPALAQWVVSAYAVLFAGFLVAGGRLTDRVGARRVFVVAMVAFGVASAVGGAATTGAALLPARGVQGLAAAMLQPAVLGLIGTSFPAGAPRSRALAVWGSVGALGLAAGVILGGLLTTVSWRLTFVVNVPVTLLCTVGAVAWTRTGERGTRQRIPLVAAVLGTGTALTAVLALTLAADAGWTSPPTLACSAVAVAMLAAFVRNERKARDVLIEPVLRHTRSLRVGAAATACYMASVGSEFYLLTLLLQVGKGYGPLHAGLAFLPMALLVAAGSASAGRAVRRFSPAVVLATGFVLAVAGLLWLSLTLHGDSYVRDLLPGLVLSGYGHGAVYTSMFVLGTHDVAPAYHGTSGALLTTSQYLSGALTVALLTAVLGAAPDDGRFRAAFLVTTAAAVCGALLAARERPRDGRPAGALVS